MRAFKSFLASQIWPRNWHPHLADMPESWRLFGCQTERLGSTRKLRTRGRERSEAYPSGPMESESPVAVGCAGKPDVGFLSGSGGCLDGSAAAVQVDHGGPSR